MGRPVRQKPVKLVCSLIYREKGCLEKAEGELVTEFGIADPVERVLKFDYTDYYYGEMGGPLERKLICFRGLVPPGEAYKSKLATNAIEERLASGGRRSVNIDPGYLTEAKLVLFTTKDFNHRVYVGGDIFAETTLFFKDGAFRPWPWTYPDYASPGIRDYFDEVRALYVDRMKRESVDTGRGQSV